jgi:molybdopterin/thiamine biosynthesis adenylyltransferase
MNVVIIGLGGIGSIISEKVLRYLHTDPTSRGHRLTFIDGDEYEEKNLIRQDFLVWGNKAKSKYDELNDRFINVSLGFRDYFINEKNIYLTIQENDIIFLCVDNHKSRKVVSDYCKTLQNVTLISGGNEYTDGNAQLYVRRGGVDITPDLCAYHPEIRNSLDKSPEQMSCIELQAAAPQLYFTNMSVATMMLWLFYNSIVRSDFSKSEVYFDMVSMSADSKIRRVKN